MSALNSKRRLSDSAPKTAPKRHRLSLMATLHMQALREKKAVVLCLREQGGAQREFAVALDRETAINIHYALGDHTTLLGNRWTLGWACDPLLLPHAVASAYKQSAGGRDASTGFFDTWGVKGVSLASARGLADFLYVAAREALARTIDMRIYKVALVVVSPDEFSCRDGAIVTQELFHGMLLNGRKFVHYHGMLDLVRHAHLLQRGGDKAINFADDGMVLFQWLMSTAADDFQESVYNCVTEASDLRDGCLYDEEDGGEGAEEPETVFKLAVLCYTPGQGESGVQVMHLSTGRYECLQKYLVEWNQRALDDCRWRREKGLSFEHTFVLNERFSSALNPELGGLGSVEQQQIFAELGLAAE